MPTRADATARPGQQRIQDRRTPRHLSLLQPEVEVIADTLCNQIVPPLTGAAYRLAAEGHRIAAVACRAIAGVRPDRAANPRYEVTAELAYRISTAAHDASDGANGQPEEEIVQGRYPGQWEAEAATAAADSDRWREAAEWHDKAAAALDAAGLPVHHTSAAVQ